MITMCVVTQVVEHWLEQEHTVGPTRESDRKTDTTISYISLYHRKKDKLHPTELHVCATVIYKFHKLTILKAPFDNILYLSIDINHIKCLITNKVKFNYLLQIL